MVCLKTSLIEGNVKLPCIGIVEHEFKLARNGSVNKDGGGGLTEESGCEMCRGRDNERVSFGEPYISSQTKQRQPDSKTMKGKDIEIWNVMQLCEK